MNINEMFVNFLSTLSVNDKEELENAIVDYNKKALENAVKRIPFDSEKPFAGYISSDRQYIGFSLEKDNGNWLLSSDKAMDITPYKYYENVTASKATFKNIDRKIGNVAKLINEFIASITEDNEESIVSVKTLKNELEKVFVEFGFVGHVSSKAVKVYIIDKCKANKKLLGIKKIGNRAVLDIMYNISCYNENNMPAPAPEK